MLSNQTLILAIKMCHVYKPFIQFYTFFLKINAWISLDFLVQKNLDNFVDYLGYYKNYFGSTAMSCTSNLSGDWVSGFKNQDSHRFFLKDCISTGILTPACRTRITLVVNSHLSFFFYL